MSIRPRPFAFPNVPSTWFIGHMSLALKQISDLITTNKVDILIEARDARLPLTSINPVFEQLIKSRQTELPGGGKTLATKRIVVYNKSDLAQTRFHPPLLKALKEQNPDEDVLFTHSKSRDHMNALLTAISRNATRTLDGEDDRISVLVVGMPNVGKSSLLNGLRHIGVHKGKAASTSPEPGHTRRLSSHIKISTSPPIYISDTPGIMVPFLGRGNAGKETALKLALTGGMKEALFEAETVREYLLWRLYAASLLDPTSFPEEKILSLLGLPLDTTLSDPVLFFTALAIRLKAVQKGGALDLDFAGRWFVRFFREGKMNNWTLDSLGRDGVEAMDWALPEVDDAAPALLPLPPPRSPVPTLKPEIQERAYTAVQRHLKEQESVATDLAKVSKHAAKRAAKDAAEKVRFVKRAGAFSMLGANKGGEEKKRDARNKTPQQIKWEKKFGGLRKPSRKAPSRGKR